MSGDEHSFLPSNIDGTPDMVFFDESHFSELIESQEYERQKNADKQSYFWDHLIEKFIRIGDPTLAHPDIQQTNIETERALRTIAGESRFRRRLLVDGLFSLMRAAPPGKRQARILTSNQLPELVYIFLVQPRLADESYEQYRRHRAAILHAYCRCAKLRFPHATRFVGVGVDHPMKSYPGVSEDLMVYESPRELSDEDRAEAEHFRELLGIFGAGLTEKAFHADEFPRANADPAADERK